jgi:signal transduction histidine kinase
MAAGDKVKILLVDDNAAKRAALAAVVETLDQDLVIAASSEEALRLALQHDFAVMLLDVQMPDMDGLQLAAAIRERPRSRQTPIIFLTSYSRADMDALQGYSLGAVDFMFAPVIPQVLQAKVKVFIELAAARARLEAEIAERKRVQEEIVALNAELQTRAEQLEAANQELEGFSYTVSHDLRAPLRAINGFAHTVLEDYSGKLNAEGKRLLGVVLDQSSYMGQLIDDLLEFSRLGRKELTRHQIDMSALAAEVLQELEPRPGDSAEIRLKPLAPALGDPLLVRQVWTNLLSNAVKFSSARNRPEIEVGSFNEGDETVFYVKDNGAGFDMRYYDKLFGVFHRLHRHEEFPGTGVGLALVHRVVSRHGGRVWAESKVGQGATFYFTLPPPAHPARGAELAEAFSA